MKPAKKNKKFKKKLPQKNSPADKETKIQQIVNHYFYTKGLSLKQIKHNAKKKKIIYSRFTKPAKQLLVLAGSVKKAKQAIDKVADWAKEIVKKPFYQGKPMVWSQTKKKWFVINEDGQWLEFAGKEKDIKWKIADR